MELKNKGTFSIVYVQKKQKYCITYNTNNAELVLPNEKYHFDFYTAAQEYIDKHIEELDNYVTELKAKALKRKQEQEAERLRQEQEAERLRQEQEAERLRQEQEAERLRQEQEAERLRQEQEKRKQEEEKKKKPGFWYGFRRFIAGFLVAVITLVGGHYAAKGISKINNNNKTPGTSQTPTNPTNPTNPTTPTNPTIDYTLTKEVFEDLTAKFSKNYTDKGVSVSTEDLLNFVAVANINRLVEENPDLAMQLFEGKSISEYVSDAAKILGMTYGYNYRIYEKENSTENFIRISEGFNGESKEIILEIESYVDRFHEVKDDEKATNELAVEFYDALTNPNSKLSYLDHGMGFAIQTYIELITDHIAKNTMSQENRDLFKAYSTSEKFIKGIRSKIGEMQMQTAICANVNIPTYELKLKSMSAKTRTRKI